MTLYFFWLQVIFIIIVIGNRSVSLSPKLSVSVSLLVLVLLSVSLPASLSVWVSVSDQYESENHILRSWIALLVKIGGNPETFQKIPWQDLQKVLDEIMARTVRHIIQNQRFWMFDYGCYKAHHPKRCIQKDDQKYTGNDRFWILFYRCYKERPNIRKMSTPKTDQKTENQNLKNFQNIDFPSVFRFWGFGFLPNPSNGKEIKTSDFKNLS